MPASRVLQVSGIEAKLHLPSTAARPATLAIIAHPWARLGGNWRDSVVQHLASIFLASAVPAVLFNSRGAGRTIRTPSWTGEGERDDYSEVLDAGIRDVFGSGETGEVFICGYSQGALFALAQNPVLRSFKVYKVLISPPLSVRWFLTPGLSTTLPIPSPNQTSTDREHALVLYGTSDVFTSGLAVRSWVAKSNGSRQVVRSVEIQEGDHFWRSGKEDGLARMEEEVKRWLKVGWRAG